MDRISIRGARTHNLQNVDLDLPRGRLVVVTGLSGSGKSSLAFDTLYAEGQRRFVETLSPYARQFLDQMVRPDVDSIEGLSPAIAIEQRQGSRNPRSTVATATEIHDYLRLLFARVGVVHCPRCGRRVEAHSPSQMVERVLALPEGTRFSVLAPIARGQVGSFAAEIAQLRKQGFVRASVDGALVDLAELDDKRGLDPGKPHDIDVYVDRLARKAPVEQVRTRLADSIELAARVGGGLVKILPVAESGLPELLFSERFACTACGAALPEVEPRLFSWSSPHGACPACDGVGARLYFDPARLVPDEDLPLREGAIEPWTTRNATFYQAQLEALAARTKIDMLAPFRDLSPKQRALVLRGEGAPEIEIVVERDGKKQSLVKQYEAVIPNLERRLAEHERRRRDGLAARGGADSDSLEAAYEELHRYTSQTPCEACGGTRLRAEARSVTIDGRAITDCGRMTIASAQRFFAGLPLGPRERAIAERVLREIQDRLRFLVDVGLDYLTLDREGGTLSGGESQRIRLATQIGAALVGVLYVLDEPSIGLHPRDNARLLDTLRALRDRGNTVVVVEHDAETIRAADFVVDMGPRAGVHGGRVVAAGPPEAIERAPGSLTGDYLSGRKRVSPPASRRPPDGRFLEILGARAHNLGGVDARFPVGRFTCVTGVSGSGKSSLVTDTLLPALTERSAAPRTYDEIKGIHFIDKVIAIDQAPIGRTRRSNPASYAGVFAPVRELFAALPESKARGYKAARYSFNVKGGRCEVCQGEGNVRIEMHFLPDVHVQCDACRGRRYNRETLEVLYKGASIADVLDMTVAQAAELFASAPKIRPRLETLRDVGLGYITLGQPATTLSGGEAQRIKLATELARKGPAHRTPAGEHTLYLLDEPTTGLHFDDVARLLSLLQLLVDAGDTVIVIEHDLDVIASADWVIDLGPEGGAGGGSIVACGTPEEIAGCAASYTGRWLRAALATQAAPRG